MSLSTIQPDQLPGTIRSYLAARDTDAALNHFVTVMQSDLIAELVIAP